MKEADVVERIRGCFAAAGALAEREDDDTARMPAVPAGCARVVTTDVFVEGRDFERALAPLASAGGRALVQNLSDLAAAGARPAGFVWSLTMPARFSIDDVEQFATGAAAIAARYSCALLGGDLSSTDGVFSCAITAFGDVHGAPLVRSGARAGDVVWISGKTGASAAGLRALREKSRETSGPIARAIDAHLHPRPALDVGAQLVGVATACIDVSDGLLLDLARIARASNVAMKLDALDDAIDREAGATQEDARGGGEDWVLAFIAPQGARIPAGCIRLGDVITPDEGGARLWENGARLEPVGWDHFG